MKLKTKPPPWLISVAQKLKRAIAENVSPLRDKNAIAQKAHHQNNTEGLNQYVLKD